MACPSEDPAVPENEEGRAYTRPASGTGKSLQRDAFDTPPVGGAPQAMSSEFEITGFDADSSRSYAKLNSLMKL